MKIHNPFTDKVPAYIPIFTIIVGAFIFAILVQITAVKIVLLIGLTGMFIRVVYFLLKGK